MIDILLNTTFFMLPVAGATLLLIKVLFEYIFRWDINRESNAKTRSAGIRIVTAGMAVSLGALLCFFSICFLFFPAYKIPEYIKISGIILYFGFWCITGIVYLLARAAKSEAISRKTNRVLNKLFVVTADHKVTLNPRMNICELLRYQNRKDPPSSNAA
ncbi:MAG: hypothetical protein JRF72_15875 [Deltaproteobacteria bacterium]|jgi:hypothetical protein|nr:hypothetical protein [Deltaproteobacteria bacterium]